MIVSFYVLRFPSSMLNEKKSIFSCCLFDGFSAMNFFFSNWKAVRYSSAKKKWKLYFATQIVAFGSMNGFKWRITYSFVKLFKLKLKVCWIDLE